MIGTIIIAVTGYGVVIYLLVIAFGASCIVKREPSGSLKGKTAGHAVVLCLGLAVLIAVITRWLAGV